MQTIEDLRRDKGWTQKQLGKRLGLSGQSVYLWESGRSLPNAIHLREIAKVFGVCMEAIDVETPWRQKRSTA